MHVFSTHVREPAARIVHFGLENWLLAAISLDQIIPSSLPVHVFLPVHMGLLESPAAAVWGV